MSGTRLSLKCYDPLERSAGGRVDEKRKFVGHSFELLPVEERVRQYREMADATFLKAQKMEDPIQRTRYLSMAASWHALAQEMEKGNPDAEAMRVLSTEADRQPDTN